MKRAGLDITGVRQQVESILEAVKVEGDKALYRFSREFDQVDLQDLPVRVPPEEMEQVEQRLDSDVKAAIRYAVENIRTYHRGQKPETMQMTEVRPGILAGERATPIESVGLYVPRGRGSFPSMLYMLAIPAAIAGVKRICVITPPDSHGRVDPACLFTAKLSGVHELYRIGGAHAIAAMAFGTESIAPVVKIIGPGSIYVAAAKQLLYGTVDVGLPAGPSESVILADETADAASVALDLLIEAEHGADSQALLLTPSEELARATAERAAGLIEELPEPRKTFVRTVLDTYGGIFITDTLEDAARITNQLAPEHLQVRTAEVFETLSLITNAGEILLGEHTPFSVANYLAGPNAVLPTGGTAKTFSPVSVRDFMKYSSVIHVTSQGYHNVRDHVITLAEYEGFPAHANALRKRS
jgi:histidinol dehydrogenase